MLANVLNLDSREKTHISTTKFLNKIVSNILWSSFNLILTAASCESPIEEKKQIYVSAHFIQFEVNVVEIRNVK